MNPSPLSPSMLSTRMIKVFTYFPPLVLFCLTFSDPISFESSTSLTPDDHKMSEELQINGSVTVHTNGHGDDVQMVDTDSQTPGATPGISGDFSMASIDGSSTSITRSYPDDSDEHGEPPAKRARILSSDVDMHYTAHVSPYFFTSVRCNGRADLACLFPAAPSSRNPAASFCRHFHCCKFHGSPLPSLILHQLLPSSFLLSRKLATLSSRNPAPGFCHHLHCCKSCASTYPSLHFHCIGSCSATSQQGSTLVLE